MGIVVSRETEETAEEKRIEKIELLRKEQALKIGGT